MMSEIRIANTRPEHLAALAEHQKICFPTLDPSEWMTAEHFASHLRLFPEGQHVALDGERVVGQSSTFRIGGARALGQHQYMDILGQSYFTNHDPHGEWLYGADMSVHPDYRGRKISTMLYNARKDLVRRLGLRQLGGRRHADRPDADAAAARGLPAARHPARLHRSRRPRQRRDPDCMGKPRSLGRYSYH
jgi:GNAT superfamily N-acetyltransferase